MDTYYCINFGEGSEFISKRAVFFSRKVINYSFAPSYEASKACCSIAYHRIRKVCAYATAASPLTYRGVGIYLAIIY